MFGVFVIWKFTPLSLESMFGPVNIWIHSDLALHAVGDAFRGISSGRLSHRDKYLFIML